MEQVGINDRYTLVWPNLYWVWSISIEARSFSEAFLLSMNCPSGIALAFKTLYLFSQTKEMMISEVWLYGATKWPQKSERKSKRKSSGPSGADSNTVWFFCSLMHASFLFIRNTTSSNSHPVLLPEDYITWLLNFIAFIKQGTWNTMNRGQQLRW